MMRRYLLKAEQLKNWLHHDLSQADKLLIILGSFDSPGEVGQVKARGRDAGLRKIGNWNVSSILAGTKGKAIRTEAGWELNQIACGGVSEIAGFFRAHCAGCEASNRHGHVLEGMN